MPVKESVIRKMTRLAWQYKAVNLSQGFPNEGPPWKLRLALAHGVLSGQDRAGLDSSEEALQQSLMNILQQHGQNGHLLEDQTNQYSPPMGRQDVRQGISDYYQRFYGYNVSPNDITVTLGATEAFACALRTVGRPGDKCVIFEPFHELYPAQCKIFYLEPLFVTLRANAQGSAWTYDKDELEAALQQAKLLLFNSPHNPTGKVFGHDQLKEIVDLCLAHDVTMVTDEIYEHMCFDGQHLCIPQEFPSMAHRTLVCNSLGKSASATGWRLGWCLHPPQYSEIYRGIHDQMAVMSPHPVQLAALEYLTLPDVYFQELAARYHGRVSRLASVLQHVGFQVIFPQGAYYLFVDYTQVKALQGLDSMEAAMFLLQKVGVACVPGDNFYGKASDGQNYLRFAACRSDSDLEEAAKRLQALEES